MGDELDGFLSGGPQAFPSVPGGSVNLSIPPQPLATSIGNSHSPDAPLPGGSMDSVTTGFGGQIDQMANLGASLGGVAATALVAHAGKLGVTAPDSLKGAQEKAQGLLSKAQPWKTFLLPLSKPEPGKGFPRITSNLYQFQVNYAILFLVQIALSILMDPSTLLTLIVIALIWIGFLKKNADPEWDFKVGGVPLGPTQRMIALACITLLVMLATAGNIVFWQAVMFAISCAVHGYFHEVEVGQLPPEGGNTQLGVSL
eukprot:gnl/MRDRNA2_/MRDRNA2_27675_c0_seq1.p1 gnl/MRDRNA2_/MRDRNA2_27675_c0~~gnl/MRDRNA2_/MRDRNA2_27675_c0_seq1.p1  ORF type:complete len:257 (+),score=46.55 gnl/MRDRNA2_/MRDRNA2_27675_c0_seq1:88-858(+)